MSQLLFAQPQRAALLHDGSRRKFHLHVRGGLAGALLYERARIIARAISDGAHSIIGLTSGLSIQVHDVRAREHGVIALGEGRGHRVDRRLKGALITHHATLRIAPAVQALDQSLDSLLRLLRALRDVLSTQLKRVKARGGGILRLA